MTIKRYIASILCLTISVVTLFSHNGMQSYALSEDSFTNDTIVIQNGKVISGSTELVDSGLIVIGQLEDVTEDTKFATNDTLVSECEKDVVEDIGSAVEASSVSANTTATSKMEDIKTPTIETGRSALSTSTPDITPTAVNPNVPSEGVKATYVLNQPINNVDENYDDDPETSWLTLNTTSYIATLKATTTQIGVSTTCSTKYSIQIGNGQTLEMYYHQNGTATSIYPGIIRSNTSTDTIYSYPLFTVKSGGTLNLSGNTSVSSGGRFVLDGDGTEQSGYTSTQPLIVVENGGVCNISYADFRQNWISNGANGAAIYVKAGGTLTIDNVLFRDLSTTGNGGAIYVEANSGTAIANVTINNSNGTMYMGSTGDVVKAANGAGIYMGGGVVTLNNGYIQLCTASNNGGGIYVNDGSLTINGGNYGLEKNASGVERKNTALDGGAIYVAGGTVSISNATFSSNTATKSGSAGGHGGAIAVVGGVVTIDSGTNITSNSANVDGGGVFCKDSGIINIKGGTIQNNTGTQGGGAYASGGGTINMSGGTISSNTGAGVFLYAGAFFNLSGGTIESNTPSSYKGGGVAIYHNAGGKFTMSGGTIQNHSGDRAHGVAQTVNTSQAFGNGGEIEIKGGTITNNNPTGDGGGIYCEAGSVSISNGNIVGNTATLGAGIHATANCTSVSISGGTIQNNTASSNGGGVNCQSGSLSISGGNITGNTGGYGGGVRAANCTTVTISGGTIQGNTARSNGGGIALVGTGNASMTTTISGDAYIYNNTANGINSTTGYGGGISFNMGYLTISGGKIDKNTANGSYGGGIYIQAATNVTITGSAEIIRNSAAADGGGIKLDAGKLTLSGGFIGTEANANTAVNGAGVAASGGTVIMSGNASVAHNQASATGGGIYIKSASFESTGGSINKNTATTDAGGMYFEGSTLSISNSGFTSNTATNGHAGGIYAKSYTSLSISGTSFDGNTAKLYGGALRVDCNVLALVSNCTFTGNQADTGGGAMVYREGVVAFTDCTFTGNRAVYYSSYGIGGAIAVVHQNGAEKNAAIFLINTSIGVEGEAQNTANCLGGGGIFAGESTTVVMIGGQICNNAATGTQAYGEVLVGNGGGINTESALTISNDLSALSGTVAEGLINTYTGTISRPQIYGNSASCNGGGIYASDLLASAKDEVVITITNADVYGNTATTFTPGNDDSKIGAYLDSTTGIGGGIHLYNAAYTISGCTIGKDGAKNEAVSGGGIAIYKGSQGTITDTNISYNKARFNGGGVFIIGCGENEADKSTEFNISNSTVSYNRVAEVSSDVSGRGTYAGGAAFHIRGLTNYNDTGVNATIDNVAISNNTSQYSSGGGILVHEYVTLTLKNCNSDNGTEFKNNYAGDSGGAISMCQHNSVIDVDNCTFTANSSRLRGGTFYILKSGLTLDDVVIDGSMCNLDLGWGDSGRGGAIYIINNQEYNPETGANDFPDIQFTFNNVKFINCEARYGGAIFVDTPAATSNFKTATIILNECEFISNSATVNGGAILVTAKGAVQMNGGYIIANHAGNSSTTVTESPYLKAYNATAGVGGGVAIFGGTFKLDVSAKNGAIYGNLAAIAGDDLFSNGTASAVITVPDVTDMTVYTGTVENAPTTLPSSLSGYSWYEDYMTSDGSYAQGLNGNGSFIFRYRETPLSIAADTNEINSIDYVSITVGTYKNNTGKITISTPKNADPDQLFVYTITAKPLDGAEYSLTVSLKGGETVEIHSLSAGTYEIKQHTPWAWRYDFDNVTQVGGSNELITGDTIKFYLACSVADDSVAVTFTNTKTADRWLDHNSTPVKNKAVGTNVASLFVGELPKRHIVL